MMSTIKIWQYVGMPTETLKQMRENVQKQIADTAKRDAVTVGTGGLSQTFDNALAPEKLQAINYALKRAGNAGDDAV